MLVEGAISTKACILANKRRVNTVYIDRAKRSKDFNFIRKLCLNKNIDVKEIDRLDFEAFNVGKSFGGICCEVENRANDLFDKGDIFYLDGIEDPFNLGYVIRTLYAFNIKNILLPLKDYSNMEAQIIKSSAGAFEYANIIKCEDTYDFISSLKKDYTIYALQRGDDSFDIFDEKFKDKCLFMLGGEKRGISSKLLSLTDRFVYIPYGNDFRNSLSGASSCDVVATLLFGQRK